MASIFEKTPVSWPLLVDGERKELVHTFMGINRDDSGVDFSWETFIEDRCGNEIRWDVVDELIRACVSEVDLYPWGDDIPDWVNELVGEMDAELFEKWQEVFALNERYSICSKLPVSFSKCSDDFKDVEGFLDFVIKAYSLYEEINRPSKARFRAMRESIGATQAVLAEKWDIALRTIKRWEAPGQPEPKEDAFELLLMFYESCCDDVERTLRNYEQFLELEGSRGNCVVYIPYFRNQEQLIEMITAHVEEENDALRDSVIVGTWPNWFMGIEDMVEFWAVNACARMFYKRAVEKAYPVTIVYPEELPEKATVCFIAPDASILIGYYMEDEDGKSLA
jgi:hypothetical protein